MRDIIEVWQRIKAHQNERFETKTHKPLTYEVAGNFIDVDRSPSQKLHIGQVEKALERVPVDGPNELHDLRGPSYLWAILHDPRIRMSDW